MMTIAPNPIQPPSQFAKINVHPPPPFFKNIESVNGNETPRSRAGSTCLPPLTSFGFNPAIYMVAIWEK
jgi:hypothetical protein